MWNHRPSGFWPCESSTHIYWCCVHCHEVDCKGAAVNLNSCMDQIRAVTPRFAYRSNGLDLQSSWNENKELRKSSLQYNCGELELEGMSECWQCLAADIAAKQSATGHGCPNMATCALLNLNSRCETAWGSSSLNCIQTWFCNSTVARTANWTCSLVPWSC